MVVGSWDVPTSNQYHIQTDEGPERYFRFQTDNGQFRKEKRLQDGTVIGTEAWIDAAGFLRQKDYIADTKGYRILKSKIVFVGHDRHIEDAIKSAKTVAAQSGVLVTGNTLSNSIDYSNQENKHSTGYIYGPTTTPDHRATRPTLRKFGAAKLDYLSPAEAAELQPSAYLGFDHYPDEQSHRTADNQDFFTPGRHSSDATIVTPSLNVEPPLLNTNQRRPIRPIGLESSIPTPITVEAAQVAPSSSVSSNGYSLPAPFKPVLRPSAGYHYSRQPSLPEEYNSDPSLPADINNLRLLQPPYPPTHRRSQSQSSSGIQSNALETVYEPLQDISNYDGVSTTRNGFRYVLPHHYHEEEQVSDNKRAGSFGYVDPFGIRRVVYYNASPEKGFVHRNNNRYVGLNGKPYDPRP